jgi:hypothetical protein
MTISAFSCNFVKVTQDNEPPFFFGIWKVEGFLSGELGNSNECLEWTDTLWYDDGDIRAAKSYSVWAMTVGSIIWLTILATLFREPGTVYQMIVASTCLFCAVMAALFFQVLGSDVCHINGITCRFGAAAYTSLLALALWTWTCFTFLNLVLESREDDIFGSSASSSSAESASKRRDIKGTNISEDISGDEEQGIVEMTRTERETPLTASPPSDADVSDDDETSNRKGRSKKKRKKKKKRKEEAIPETDYQEKSTSDANDMTLSHTPQKAGTSDDEHGKNEILPTSPPSPPFRVFVDGDSDEGKPIRKEPIRSILKNKVRAKATAPALAVREAKDPVSAEKKVEVLPDSPASPPIRVFLDEEQEIPSKTKIRQTKVEPKAQVAAPSNSNEEKKITIKENVELLSTRKPKEGEQGSGAAKDDEQNASKTKDEEKASREVKDKDVEGGASKLDEKDGIAKEADKEPADTPSLGAPLVCVYTDDEGRLIKTTIRLFTDDEGQSVIEKTIEKLDQTTDDGSRSSSSSSSDSSSSDSIGGIDKWDKSKRRKRKKKKRSVTM